MTMTRKHYRLIAKLIKDNTIIHNNKPMKSTINKDCLIVDLCVMFKDDNKLFNSDRFIKACE